MRRVDERTMRNRRSRVAEVGVCVPNARCHLSVRYYRRDCYDSFVGTERSVSSISRAPIILIDSRNRYVILGIMGLYIFRASCVFSL